MIDEKLRGISEKIWHDGEYRGREYGNKAVVIKPTVQYLDQALLAIKEAFREMIEEVKKDNCIPDTVKTTWDFGFITAIKDILAKLNSKKE